MSPKPDRNKPVQGCCLVGTENFHAVNELDKIFGEDLVIGIQAGWKRSQIYEISSDLSTNLPRQTMKVTKWFESIVGLCAT